MHDERSPIDPALVGYARFNAPGQGSELAIEAMRRAGVDSALIFTDIASGNSPVWERPGFQNALNACPAGGTFVVSSAERLSRNDADYSATVNRLEKRGIGFRLLESQPKAVEAVKDELRKGLTKLRGQFANRAIRQGTD